MEGTVPNSNYLGGYKAPVDNRHDLSASTKEGFAKYQKKVEGTIVAYINSVKGKVPVQEAAKENTSGGMAHGALKVGVKAYAKTRAQEYTNSTISYLCQLTLAPFITTYGAGAVSTLLQTTIGPVASAYVPWVFGGAVDLVSSTAVGIGSYLSNYLSPEQLKNLNEEEVASILEKKMKERGEELKLTKILEYSYLNQIYSKIQEFKTREELAEYLESFLIHLKSSEKEGDDLIRFADGKVMSHEQRQDYEKIYQALIEKDEGDQSVFYIGKMRELIESIALHTAQATTLESKKDQVEGILISRDSKGNILQYNLPNGDYMDQKEAAKLVNDFNEITEKRELIAKLKKDLELDGLIENFEQMKVEEVELDVGDYVVIEKETESAEKEIEEAELEPLNTVLEEGEVVVRFDDESSYRDRIALEVESIGSKAVANKIENEKLDKEIQELQQRMLQKENKPVKEEKEKEKEI